MYYPSSENKGADQLRGYREADLRLCFRLCRLLVFPVRWLIYDLISEEINHLREDKSNIDEPVYTGHSEWILWLLVSSAVRLEPADSISQLPAILHALHGWNEIHCLGFFILLA